MDGVWARAGAVAWLAVSGSLPALAFAQNATDATDGLTLARQENCTSCHAVDRQLMGPPLRDVAARYATLPSAGQYLARKISEGSAGVWGVVPMPANTQLTPDEANRLARWILTLR